jgi:predicted MFS family arabinose efflux permease
MLKNKALKTHYQYVIIASTFVIMAAMFGPMFTFGLFLNPISTEFGWGRAVLSGAWSISILLSGFLGILAGRLSDRFGPRRVVLICSLFFGLGFVLMSQISTIWQVYLFYGVLVAIGTSAGIAPLESTVAKWFAKTRGLMIAICLIGMSTGDMIMPPIVNRLIILYGWRAAYIILGTVSFLVIFLAALLLKRDPPQIGKLPYGADDRGGYKAEPQYRSRSGFSLCEAFQTVQFWLVSTYFFCIAFAMMTIVVHIVPYIIDMGISPTIASTVMSIIGGISIATRLPEGFMADRIGVKKTATILTGFLVGSMLWLLITGEEMWTLFLFAIIFGLAFSSLDILLTLLPSNLFGLMALGSIIGFVNFIVTVGGAVGSFGAGLIFDLTGNYYLALLLCSIVSAIALGISSFSRSIRQVDRGF